MVKYYCKNCTEWVDGSEVTEEEVQYKRGTPYQTVYVHDRCGSGAEKAGEDSAV